MNTNLMNKRRERRRAFLDNFRKNNPKPYFEFQPLPDSERLSFEMLNWDNYRRIYEMFKDDENPFIQKEFRNLYYLEEYVDYHLNLNRYSAKRGACDWFFKLKDSNTYLGLLNLYDLSLETFADNHLKCTIGFNTRAAYRRKGYTQEAVRHFIRYIFENYEMKRILAYTDKGNRASIDFLEKLNFVNNTLAYLHPDKYEYYEYWPIPIHLSD